MPDVRRLASVNDGNRRRTAHASRASHSLEPGHSTCFQDPANQLHRASFQAGVFERAYLAARSSVCEHLLQSPQHHEHGLRLQLTDRFE